MDGRETGGKLEMAMPGQNEVGLQRRGGTQWDTTLKSTDLMLVGTPRAAPPGNPLVGVGGRWAGRGAPRPRGPSTMEIDVRIALRIIRYLVCVGILLAGTVVLL